MSELGEKTFLKALLPALYVDPTFVNGFGHDASIVDVGLQEHIAIKIDRAPYPVALKKGIGDYRTWGRLAVAANVSDLLAVGASPRALILSLVLPGSFDAVSAGEIVKGCEEACITHGVAFVGGDTKEGAAAQVIGAAFGTVAKGYGFGRANAASGDYLYVAGQLGAFSGVVAMLDASDSCKLPPVEWADVLTRPSARVREGEYLRKLGSVIAACDLSDGLAEAIRIFCKAGTGITVDEANLPIHRIAVEAATRLQVPAWRFAFGVGDWAIAFVAKYMDVAILDDLRNKGLEIFKIGRFNDSGKRLVRSRNGVKFELPDLINEQFRQRIEDGDDYISQLLHKR